MRKISIYGCGMFGFALAKYLGDKFQNSRSTTVMSYERRLEIVQHINLTRKHLYHFPHIELSSKNKITNSISDTIDKCDILILAIPSQNVRDVIKKLKPLIEKDVIIVNTAKALECNTNQRLSQVVAEELSDLNYKYAFAQLSGGTIALDLANNAPLGVDVACEDITICNKLQELFSSSSLRVYSNSDLIGTEYAGAFKNVIAILAGIISGMELPFGSETHIISRSSKEACDLAIKLGAKEQTFSTYSQSWGNDLWMSCMGNTRNRYFGELIGKGLTTQDALELLYKEHKIAEGYNTAKLIPELCERTGIKAHILMEVYHILYQNKECKLAMDAIMNKELEYIA